jgi:hypothetical protein
MGLKVGPSPNGVTNIDGVWEVMCWGEYLDLTERRWQEDKQFFYNVELHTAFLNLAILSVVWKWSDLWSYLLNNFLSVLRNYFASTFFQKLW